MGKGGKTPPMRDLFRAGFGTYQIWQLAKITTTIIVPHIEQHAFLVVRYSGRFYAAESYGEYQMLFDVELYLLYASRPRAEMLYERGTEFIIFYSKTNPIYPI